MVPALLAKAAQLLWSSDPKTHIRLRQWAIGLLAYGAWATAMAFGAAHGLFAADALKAWLFFLGAGLSVFYGMLRSGSSRRFANPAFIEWQAGFGVLVVLWAYLIGGDVRGAMLFPMMVMLTSSSFSLSWQRIVWQTVLAVTALALTMLGMHLHWPGRFDLRVDIANFLAIAIFLPAIALLAGSLGSWLRAQRNELKTALARIEELATRDGLTGLVNRRHAQYLVELEHERCKRAGKPFSLTLVDLDHFKRVNDLHGHVGGDQALCAFAQEALATVRACDTVARWGGEEFLLLMPETDSASAGSAVERLRVRVERLRLATGSGELAFTLSAGIVEHVPGEAVADTVARADRALYDAKATGRNRIVAG